MKSIKKTGNSKRKRSLIYEDYFPFHVTTRIVSRNDFSLPKNQIWRIFARHLNALTDAKKIKVHAFVLMSNHYHLIASPSPRFDFNKYIRTMECLVYLDICAQLGCVADDFEKPPLISKISTPTHYRRVLKYVYRNPVASGICKEVQDYKFSTLMGSKIKTVFPYNIDSLINYKKQKILPWLNSNEEGFSRFKAGKGLENSYFNPLIFKYLRLWGLVISIFDLDST